MENRSKLLIQLVFLITAARADLLYEDFAGQQLKKFAHRTGGPIGTLTTGNGAPVDYRDANTTLNRNILNNEFLSETLSHLNRQRIPERVVHALGAGAFGYFEVTHDVTNFCKAKFLQGIGRRTPVAVRFSTTISNAGGVDIIRDARGFSVKFYTDDGNFDLIGLNIPIFTNKDPLFFAAFANAQGRNPATHNFDENMLWDYITSRPETIYFYMYRYGDRGIPKGYRHMPGFSIHTYQTVNKDGVPSFVRFHFVSNQGSEYFTSAEAILIGGENPDYARKDLYNAIANKDYPSWDVLGQFLTLDQVNNADFDPFDVTKELPQDKYPLQPIGRILLNRNPVNYFAEVQQIAMNPTHLVPGILGAPDKLFEARRFVYRDAQYYRLGANFQNIPVNCPLHKPYTYNIDGVPPLNPSDAPVYYPNTYNGPSPYVEANRADLLEIVQDTSLNFDQASNYYRNLTEDEN